MKKIHLLKWIMLAVVKPVIMFALVVNGIPPTIRALAQAIATIAKAIK